ncbi:MAG: transposase [Burkholderiaceae bacterium]|nr:transposase [Burkholderiaceae bacterium]
MSRPLRLELAGGLYHITSRGDRREDIFLDDDDREYWLATLAQVCQRHHWVCHAWCQMSNHYHLIIETVEANLSQGMRQLNGVYTQSMNRKHRRVGHVFQGRYKAIMVEKDAYLLELARYVVLNPIRARMVKDINDWRWSSYPAMIGIEASPPWLQTNWLLGQFGKQRKRAIARYMDFVREGVGLPSIWDALRSQVFLGRDEFLERMQDLIDPDRAEIPRTQRRLKTLPLVHYQKQSTTPHQAMAAAFASGDYTLQKIAEYFGVHYSTVSRAVKRSEVGN